MTRAVGRLVFGIPLDCPQLEREARTLLMKHDLAAVFHCSPLALDELPHKLVALHYAIMVARDKQSRPSQPPHG